jgi:hypothetical protein
MAGGGSIFGFKAKTISCYAKKDAIRNQGINHVVTCPININ